MKYADVRLADELQFSVYNFEMANVERLWRLLGEHEAECKELLAKYPRISGEAAVSGAGDLRSGAEVLASF